MTDNNLATTARGDPSVDMLQITIFGQTPVCESLSPSLIEDFFSTETFGLVHIAFLSPFVLRCSHLFDPRATRPWILRHDSEIVELEQALSLQILLHSHSSLLNFKAHLPLRLAVFDLDSTLIRQEVIDELAKSIGMGEAVAEITHRAMHGELDFEQSLRARVALLKGVDAGSVWDHLKQTITFAEGARQLCRALKRLGVKMAVISGGFMTIAEWVAEELGLDYGYANDLQVSPPKPPYPYTFLTGNLQPGSAIVDAAAKENLVLSIAAKNGISLSDTLCVGDGANDLRMLSAVAFGGGQGIAFKAKPNVQKVAPNRLNSASLVDLLFLYGYDENEIGELIKPWGEDIVMPSNDVKYDVVDYLQDVQSEKDCRPIYC
ncbi:hypothetical protein MMC13_003237 [Lambiella insularis]|nr:hypothetical protein [Lambiella insularis]